MPRLLRFGENRYIGARDQMIVYDCDDELQFSALEERAKMESLVENNLLSAIAPDTLAEARNRGFRPLS